MLAIKRGYAIALTMQHIGLRAHLSMVGIFFIIFSCFCACNSTDNLQNSKTVVVGVEVYPEKLDPRTGVDALSSKVGKLLYNGLFKLNKNLEVVPDLAKKVKQISPTILEIRIRENIFFHDGKKLDSEDILATYDSIRDPHLQSPYRSIFEKIKKVEILSPSTIRLILTEPFSPILTSLVMGILPAEIARGTFKPVGTGPYQFGSERKKERLILKRFDRYFEGKAKNEEVHFRSIYDDTLRTLELIQGRLDIVQNAIPYVLLPAIAERSDKIKLTSDDGINFSYLGFNLKDPLLKNPKVRRAIALAINRDEVIKYKLKNLASPATSLLFPGHWAFNDQLKPYSYKPNEAKKILDSAGFPDPDKDGPRSRFSLTYKTSTKKDRVEMALLIAEYLRRIGIDVEVKSYEWGTFFRDIRIGNFQLYSLTWVGLTEPDIYYYAFHSTETPPRGANRGYYRNKKLDRLLEEGRRASSRKKRKEIYKKVQKIIFDDLPYVPLWYEHNWIAIQSNIKGYNLRSDAGFQNLISTYK